MASHHDPPRPADFTSALCVHAVSEILARLASHCRRSVQGYKAVSGGLTRQIYLRNKASVTRSDQHVCHIDFAAVRDLGTSPRTFVLFGALVRSSGNPGTESAPKEPQPGAPALDSDGEFKVLVTRPT